MPYLSESDYQTLALGRNRAEDERDTLKASNAELQAEVERYSALTIKQDGFAQTASREIIALKARVAELEPYRDLCGEVAGALQSLVDANNAADTSDADTAYLHLEPARALADAALSRAKAMGVET